jgi:hypothetical protein
MSSKSVCQAARSWVDVGSFHPRFVVRLMIFTASVRNILDTPSVFEVLRPDRRTDGQERPTVLAQSLQRHESVEGVSIIAFFPPCLQKCVSVHTHRAEIARN